MSIEKNSEIQLSILDAFATRNKLKFLHMDVRLNKREAIKRLMTKLAIRTNCTFKALFKPAIAKKVLLHYIDEP